MSLSLSTVGRGILLTNKPKLSIAIRSVSSLAGSTSGNLLRTRQHSSASNLQTLLASKVRASSSNARRSATGSRVSSNPSRPARLLHTSNRNSNLKKTGSSKRTLTTLSPRALGVNAMVLAAQNGILADDDFYRNGLPAAKFSLAQAGLTIDQIFQQHKHVDPFQIAAPDVSSISDSIQKMISSDLSVLHSIAKYFFEVNGKRVRPTIVCLLSRAMSLIDSNSVGQLPATSTTAAASSSSASSSSAMVPQTVHADSVSASQRTLSQITEMIHTASLLHDDVIDEAQTRRGVASLNSTFGNKLAILGGDFLLARASIMLARLRNPVVIELLSTVIEHLVKGEVMQMRSGSSAASSLSKLDYYLTKSYYKTASLLANSSKAVAILGGHDERTQDIAFEYGKNIGLAFQIVDDILDFTGNASKTGKAAYSDLQSGIATIPVLYAAEEFPALREMIDRKFSKIGDVQQAISLVEQSDGIERARKLANQVGESAVAAIMELPPSVPRSALITLVQRVLQRDS